VQLHEGQGGNGKTWLTIMVLSMESSGERESLQYLPLVVGNRREKTSILLFLFLPCYNVTEKSGLPRRIGHGFVYFCY